MNNKAYYELELASSIGRAAATVLERIKFWISYSKLEHEGKVFCFRTLEQLAEEVGVSVSTVKRQIGRLVSLGYLVKKKLKAQKWNQVNCYALGDRFDTSEWTDREEQDEPVEQTTLNPSLDKKSSIQRKIKKAQHKVQKLAKRAGRAFRGDKPKGLCKVCEGSGFVNDEHNNGYRCLCADGRSKSTQIPPVPQDLFISLRAQIGLS